ncbi:ExeM/NucH family extracellular endonuclease [Salipiger abyssi]|uniref:ExeM/NucH family extracellular endonuclease n=1 Tax=Salipiger abyssi TaxID=1250539 RepID=UPI0022A8359C|nr:ExeM/NucH family extracellular endonuclease [Salipiger abyssi]
MGHFHRGAPRAWFSKTIITGTERRDILLGSQRDDTISGLGGNDLLLGRHGDDLMEGGAGNDLIVGGRGSDTAVYAGSVLEYRIGSPWQHSYGHGHGFGHGFGHRPGHVTGPVIVTSVSPGVADAGRDMLTGIEALYFRADDYTLFLDGTNNAVLAADDAVSTSENGALVIDTAQLLANDREFDGDTMVVTAVDGLSASGATVSLNGTQVSYDPGSLFDYLGAGETATDTFTYTVDDGKGGADTATVTVTVEGENDAPSLLTIDSICLIEGNTEAPTVLAASDAEGDTLSYAITGGADAALFGIDAATGKLAFLSAPEAGAPLDDGADNGYDVEITVSDGNGGSVSRAVQVAVQPAPLAGRQTIAYDMVGSASQNLIGYSNTAPVFGSAGDGFGLFSVATSSSIPFALVDDSAGVYAPDSLGIIDSASNTDTFFGVTDTQNGDNDGPVSASWSFGIGGYTDLSLSVDVGAMGDFESSDGFTLTYNIDGGSETILFDFVADEDASLDYTLAGGGVFSLNDPLTVAGSGEVLSNLLQTLSADIAGTGAVLNVTLTAEADGGSEAFAMQNLVIEAAGGGSAPVEPTEYAIAALGEDAFEGDSGATGYTFQITRSGDVSAAGSVDFTVGGEVDAADFGGTLPSGTVSFAAGQTCATFTLEVAGDLTVEDDELFEVILSNPSDGSLATASAAVTVLDDDDLTLISTIQGSGAASDYVNQVVTVSAIVTQVTGSGYYLQEEDADSDGDAATSEGVFVFTGGDNPAVGDHVILRGAVEEYFGETQIDQETVRVVSSGNALPTAASVLLSPDVAQDFEAIEGMRVTLDSGVAEERLTVIENFNLDRYGEIVLSAGTQMQPTQLYDAQTEAEEIQALMQGNANNRLLIDDGVSAQNPDAFTFIPNATAGDNGNGYLDAGDTFTADGPTLRLGAELNAPVTGAMGYAYGEYRLVIDDQLDIDEATNSGARQVVPDPVGGDFQIASVNVLNYFTTLSGGVGPNGLDPRGASTAADLERQTDKLVDAILGTGAEAFALQELENGGFGDGSAIDTLVDALNAEAALRGLSASYAFVDPTGGDPDGFIGTDAITTGILYDTNSLTLVASDYIVFDEPSAATTYALAEVLNAVVPAGDRLGDFQRNRPAVAATFEDPATGERFTIVSNHFKSKGDSGLVDLVAAAQDYLDNGGTAITQADIDALTSDPNYDQGDGQGFWNAVRADAAGEVQSWVETEYDGGGVIDYLLMGDFNAYAQEDPVQTLTDDPDMVDLIDAFIGTENAYSYVFDGQQGALDQAVASAGLAGDVTGLTEWHINADEPDLLGYNSAYNDPGFYEDSLFASSDHDPLILGLDLTPDGFDLLT